MYFDVVGRLAVVYGRGLVLPLVALAAVVLGLPSLWLPGAGCSACAALASPCRSRPRSLGVALLVMAVVWGMYRTAYAQRTWSETGVVISDFYRLGLVLLTAAVIVAAYQLLLRRLRPWDLAVAALLWWLVGAVAVAVALARAPAIC